MSAVGEWHGTSPRPPAPAPHHQLSHSSLPRSQPSPWPSRPSCLSVSEWWPVARQHQRPAQLKGNGTLQV
eukprot:15225002-Alexandrium_andersonii.AAC.2